MGTDKGLTFPFQMMNEMSSGGKGAAPDMDDLDVSRQQWSWLCYITHHHIKAGLPIVYCNV